MALGMKLITLTVTYEVGRTTPDVECEDMCESIRYHLTNAANRIASDTAGHFGYECKAEVSE